MEKPGPAPNLKLWDAKTGELEAAYLWNSSAKDALGRLQWSLDGEYLALTSSLQASKLSVYSAVVDFETEQSVIELEKVHSYKICPRHPDQLNKPLYMVVGTCLPGETISSVCMTIHST